MKNKITSIKNRIEKALQKHIDENLSKPYNEAHKLLNEISLYTLLAGGKRWRAVLCVLFAELENPHLSETDYSNLDTLTTIIECIHAASLIHDDIEDASEKRRGKPSAYKAFGLDAACNTGSWLYFYALNLAKTMHTSNETKLLCYELITQAIYDLHLGQAMDINWHRTLSFFPTESQYEQMISLKTGTLASLSSKLGCLCANPKSPKLETVANLVQDLGIAFQIIDDIKNITTGLPGKDAGDDIVEGKKSLPVILHSKDHPTDTEKLISLFTQAKTEGITSKAVPEALSLLQKGGSIEKATEYAQTKVQNAKATLQKLYTPCSSLDTVIYFIEMLLSI